MGFDGDGTAHIDHAAYAYDGGGLFCDGRVISLMDWKVFRWMTFDYSYPSARTRQ